MKYKVALVLQKLQENRAKHVLEYEAVLLGYTGQRANGLKDALDPSIYTATHSAYDVELAVKLLAVKVNKLNDMPPPKNMVGYYDSAIERLTLSLDVDVDLDEKQFGAYVRDEWSWKDEFVRACNGYKGR